MPGPAMKTKFYVSSPGNMPDGPHYAIIYSTSTDDGYGGRSPAIEYVAFTDRGEWEAEILAIIRGPYQKTYRAMLVNPAKITTKVEVDVKL